MLSALQPGDLIVAECTDPMAAIDIPNLVRESGDTLESEGERQGARPGPADLPHP